MAEKVWKDHLTRKEAAAYLSSHGCFISTATLEKYAANNNAGNGPPFTSYGWRRVSYARVDLDAWRLKRGKRIG